MSAAPSPILAPAKRRAVPDPVVVRPSVWTPPTEAEAYETMCVEYDARIAREAEASRRAWADPAEYAVWTADRAAVFPVVLSSHLEDWTPPRYAVAGTIPERSVCLVHGATGSMKTFLAINILTGFSYWGQSVLGVIPSNRRRSLIVAAEGVGGMFKRLAAARQALGITGRQMIDVLPNAINLLDDTEVARLVETVERGDYGMVAIDTLAKCLTDVDENDNGKIGKALQSLEKVAAAGDGCVVLVIHHSNAHGESRGATALPNGTDVHFRVERVGDRVRVSNLKMKEDDTWAEPKYLIPRKIILTGKGDRAPVETLVLDFDETPPPVEMTDAEKVLACLHRIKTDTGRETMTARFMEIAAAGKALEMEGVSLATLKRKFGTDAELQGQDADGDQWTITVTVEGAARSFVAVPAEAQS